MRHAHDLTAERFVTVGEHGQRMYRTGDLGVQLPSGDLAYLGGPTPR